jgi:hypothetical protein
MGENGLTYDEKKAAEAAFRGLPCDPKWSVSARKVYDGIIQALQSTGRADVFDEPPPTSLVDDAERENQIVTADPGEKSNPIMNRDAAIQGGLVIDVTPVAQELGLNLQVGMSKSLWELGITASNQLQADRYGERVRDVLLALRLYLETAEVTSPYIKFPALLSFPPEVTPQLCSFYAVAHKDEATSYSLTLVLPQEMSAINPSGKNS